MPDWDMTQYYGKDEIVKGSGSSQWGRLWFNSAINAEAKILGCFMKTILKTYVSVFFLLCVSITSVQADTVYSAKRLARIGSDDSSALGVGDHTYVCHYYPLQKTICMSRTGGNSGGLALAATVQKANGHDTCVYANSVKLRKCHVNNDTAFFFSLYRNGACHQESNHMLRVSKKNILGRPILAGPTVNSIVRGGSITKLLFGNYGRRGLDSSCLSVCP
ncbi:hypothetical protein [Methyloglobulus sp.]|uniref:hypothetical protein n=1 Tax=Methyloglobulus sp. TaxID=2518622 RepID=UPI0032B7EFAD